jgi:hypothetical protein
LTFILKAPNVVLPKRLNGGRSVVGMLEEVREV